MRVKALLLATAYALALLGLMSMLTGCAPTRALYHACRDGLCR